jgi:hypothetical protein
MEAEYSSEISIDLQRNTWHYIPEERTLKYSRFQKALITRVFHEMTTADDRETIVGRSDYRWD